MNDTKTVHDDELKIPKNKQFQPPNSVKSIPLNEGYAFQVNSNRYRGLRYVDCEFEYASPSSGTRRS